MTPIDRARRALDRAMDKLGSFVRFQDRNTSDRVMDPDTGDTSTPAMPGVVEVRMIVSRTSTRADDGVTVRRATIGILKAGGIVPQLGDRITVGDIRYRIVAEPLTHYIEGVPLSYRINMEAGG